MIDEVSVRLGASLSVCLFFNMDERTFLSFQNDFFFLKATLKNAQSETNLLEQIKKQRQNSSGSLFT